MAEVTRHIGLSLGADICWPLCFEAIMKELDLRIPMNGDTIRFEVERVTIEPFDLRHRPAPGLQVRRRRGPAHALVPHEP